MKRIPVILFLMIATASCFATATYYVDVIGAPNGEAEVLAYIETGVFPPAACEFSFLGTVAPNTGRYSSGPVYITPGQGYEVDVDAQAERYVLGGGWLSGYVSKTFLYYSSHPYCVGLIDLRGFGNNEEEEENL